MDAIRTLASHGCVFFSTTCVTTDFIGKFDLRRSKVVSNRAFCGNCAMAQADESLGNAQRMDKELQAEFDYIILGTNFENSVLAG